MIRVDPLLWSEIQKLRAKDWSPFISRARPPATDPRRAPRLRLRELVERIEERYGADA